MLSAGRRPATVQCPAGPPNPTLLPRSQTDTIFTLLSPAGVTVVPGSVKAALGAPVPPTASTPTASTPTATTDAATTGASTDTTSTEAASAIEGSSSGGGSNAGAIAGAVIGVLAGVALIGGGAWVRPGP